MDMQMESQKPVLFTPRVSKISSILLRILTTIFLFLSLFILIAKVNITLLQYNKHGDLKKTIQHSYSLVGYRYMLVTIIMGSAYSIWQIIRTAIHLRKGYQGNLNLDYYGDKFMSIALSTGSVVGYITTGELQTRISGGVYSRRYFRMGYAADGFVFLGFICVLVLSELSTYARIPKIF